MTDSKIKNELIDKLLGLKLESKKSQNPSKRDGEFRYYEGRISVIDELLEAIELEKELAQSAKDDDTITAYTLANKINN